MFFFPTRLTLLVALSSLFAQVALSQNPCNSYGIDFQDGGSYFQNVLSTENFTFVSEFDGCQNDTANNLFVDTMGNQVQCSNTPLTPNDTPQLSTCPTSKNHLITGDYSVIIISNDGNAQPIAYQRDFHLSVGTQVTTTYTPTLIVPTTVTPILNATIIITDISTVQAPTPTITVPSATLSPVMTVTPSRVTSTIIKVLYTKNVTIPTLVVNRVIKTVTATCRIPQRQPTPDKRARITPTILHAKALQAPAPTPTFGPSFGPTFGNTNPWGPFGMRKVDTRELNDVPTFLAARRARLAAAGEHAIVKRAPDVPTLTITATNGIVTTVSTVTARTLTATITSTRMATITAIPAPITMMSGVTVLPEKTITLPTSTRMLTKYTIDYAMTTATYSYMITITTTVAPAASVQACKRWGGQWGW